ncbi:MAG: hypothetical protein LBS48_01115 [Treponema sp.]|jgi:hypothetical protein|nr:hypothetical protein [Treponema sp.]
MKPLIFCGIILEDSGELKIYYGADDTVVCLATADVNDVINNLALKGGVLNPFGTNKTMRTMKGVIPGLWRNL